MILSKLFALLGMPSNRNNRKCNASDVLEFSCYTIFILEVNNIVSLLDCTAALQLEVTTNAVFGGNWVALFNGQSVSVMDSLCLSQTFCVCHKKSLSGSNTFSGTSVQKLDKIYMILIIICP